MNKFLVFASILAAASARPDGLFHDSDGHVKVTQSSLGTYKYQVNLKDSLRSEERLADGTVFGEYTIPDANGLPQTIKYTSGRDGFRILDGLSLVAPVETTLPVAQIPVAHIPVEQDTVEIVASRSGLAVPGVAGTSAVFSPVARAPLEHFVPVFTRSDLPLPVEDTPEVKAAKAEFFALHRAAAARTGF